MLKTARLVRYDVLIFCAMVWLAADARADVEHTTGPPAAVEHRIDVTLDPVDHHLTAKDHMVAVQPDSPLVFRLAAHLSIDALTIDGHAAPYTRDGERVRTAFQTLRDRVEILVAYNGMFNDDVPVQPANMDNPGFGVTGTIQDQGTMLLAGARWYPDVQGVEDRYEIRVDAPEGTVAVTTGTPTGLSTENGRTTSSWSAGIDMRGLPLVAGPYTVNRRRFGKISTATYFTVNRQHLSAGYLAATGRYLQLYDTLFGPYPFDQFAVVENFFPTGYGFPSFTLMGGRVLELPFILHTSLGHEIAHCWWGNGVLVDASQGNWSEGLTTYVADYLYKERSGKGQEARDQWLQNYASLVDPAVDFPLSRFTHRMDPVSKVIGYDKGAMVFHMLRRSLGDEAFWTTLRAIYRQYRFSPVTWSDLQDAFEQQAGRSLKTFFRQWVFHAGAPRLKLADISVVPASGGYVVTGKVLQDRPYYTLALELRLKTTDDVIFQAVSIDGRQTDFSLFTRQKPLSLRADPGTHLFRRLSPAEVPPSINRMKSAQGVRVAVSRRLGERGMAIAHQLASALGLNVLSMGYENEMQAQELADSSVLFIGPPANTALSPFDKTRFGIRSAGFDLLGQRYSMPSFGFFGVFSKGFDLGQYNALYLPGATAVDLAVSRKIPHYGQYSYLVFDGARNTVKGTWPAGESPLAVDLTAF